MRYAFKQPIVLLISYWIFYQISFQQIALKWRAQRLPDPGGVLVLCLGFAFCKSVCGILFMQGQGSELQQHWTLRTKQHIRR
ncbi:hypothetical protein V8F06_007548 [Rhypophila decipiens]